MISGRNRLRSCSLPPYPFFVEHSSSRNDAQWVTLLERNNQELISQLHVLTSDTITDNKRSRASIQRAESELSTLRSRVAELHTLIRNNKKTQEITITESLRQHEAELQGHIRRIKDLSRLNLDLDEKCNSYRQSCEKLEDEVVRLKKRNAELAERIILEPQNQARLGISSPWSEASFRFGETHEEQSTPSGRPSRANADHNSYFSAPGCLAVHGSSNVYNLGRSSDYSSRQDLDTTLERRSKSAAWPSPPATDTSIVWNSGRSGRDSVSLLYDHPFDELQTGRQPVTSHRVLVTENPGHGTRQAQRMSTTGDKSLHERDNQKSAPSLGFQAPNLPHSIQRALITLQWARFLVLLCFAVGLLVRDGPDVLGSTHSAPMIDDDDDDDIDIL